MKPLLSSPFYVSFHLLLQQLDEADAAALCNVCGGTHFIEEGDGGVREGFFRSENRSRVFYRIRVDRVERGKKGGKAAFPAAEDV